MNDVIDVPAPIEDVADTQELSLVALTPAELPDQQRALAAWCDRKIAAVERERGQWVALVDEAVAGGFKHATYTANANRSERRITYYRKIKAAIEAGYLIVPNMPVRLFAVRVNRERPKRIESTYRYGRTFDTQAEALPPGAGRYVDDELPVYSRKHTEQRDGKAVEITTYFSKDYDEDIDFPLRGVHPRVLNATSRAMALKLFDEVGVVQNDSGRDPIVVGRFRDPRRNGGMTTFFIAWWLNTSDL